MHVPLLVLNYNGRHLLSECLPSLLRAADASCHECQVTVVDNDSTDDSLAMLASRFPSVHVLRQPNRGLCSYNAVLAELASPVAILLNNDVKLREDCIEPLIAPLVDRSVERRSSCFMTAPLCWRFDGHTYEGLKTAVRWRWGLVQATSLFAGHEPCIHVPGETASAGAVLAVDRLKFLELGGFDPAFLPGRLEDLDFCFRGFQAGYHARYVPQAVAFHRGTATFEEEFGRTGCELLALRNTLLFQWKNLRHPLHVARQVASLPVRLIRDVWQAPCRSPSARFVFIRALYGAVARMSHLQQPRYRAARCWVREREFFQRFSPTVIGTNQRINP